MEIRPGCFLGLNKEVLNGSYILTEDNVMQLRKCKGGVERLRSVLLCPFQACYWCWSFTIDRLTFRSEVHCCICGAAAG